MAYEIREEEEVEAEEEKKVPQTDFISSSPGDGLPCPRAFLLFTIVYLHGKDRRHKTYFMITNRQKKNQVNKAEQNFLFLSLALSGRVISNFKVR